MTGSVFLCAGAPGGGNIAHIAFEEQLVVIEYLHKFCGKIINTVSIVRILWYT